MQSMGLQRVGCDLVTEQQHNPIPILSLSSHHQCYFFDYSRFDYWEFFQFGPCVPLTCLWYFVFNIFIISRSVRYSILILSENINVCNIKYDILSILSVQFNCTNYCNIIVYNKKYVFNICLFSGKQFLKLFNFSRGENNEVTFGKPLGNLAVGLPR